MSKDVDNLSAWYRANGESAALREVEGALGEEWLTTAEVAESSGRSAKFIAVAGHYLVAEGRAETRRRDESYYAPREWRRV